MAAALPLIAYTRLNYNSSSRHTITKEMKEGGEEERISFSVYTIYHFIVLNDENSISEQITTIAYTYKTVLITYSFIHSFTFSIIDSNFILKKPLLLLNLRLSNPSIPKCGVIATRMLSSACCC
jgi:hypothetical protein